MQSINSVDDRERFLFYFVSTACNSAGPSRHRLLVNLPIANGCAELGHSEASERDRYVNEWAQEKRQIKSGAFLLLGETNGRGVRLTEKSPEDD